MSEKQIDDGGPAFPVPDYIAPNGQVQPGPVGMSLRDWFAGMALQGELASQTDNLLWPPEKYDKLARRCYEAADAMLAEREKGTQ